MESKSTLPKSLQIILPDEKPEETHDNLLDQLVIPNLSEEEQPRKVTIAIDDKVEELGEREGETEDKKPTPVEEEIPNDDFFDAKNVKEEVFGEITGMDDETVAEEEEENDSLEKNIRRSMNDARRLSINARKFAESVSVLSDDAASRASSRRPSLQSEQEAKIKEEDTEERVVQEEERVGQEDQEDQEDAVRFSKVTIVELEKFRQEEKHGEDSLTPTNFKAPMPEGSIAPSVDLPQTARSSLVSGDVRASRASRPSGPKASIYYDVQTSRVQQSVEDLSEMFDLGKSDNVILFDESIFGAEEESIPDEVEEEAPVLERQPYYEKYDRISEEMIPVRQKNFIIQKKVIMYLKRRKVENYLKDCEPPLEQLTKYCQKLDAYQEILQVTSTQKAEITEELTTLKQKRDVKKENLDKMFKAMQTRESNIGHGLIHTKTGNPIPDKLVDRLLKRQRTQMDQVSTMRLKFIKLKDMVQEKLDKINSLDILENNLRLADYEQLKADNRNHADKIEERDEELTRLRAKCQNTIQVLAHMREKSCALDSDLNDLRDELEDVDMAFEQGRGRLADLKHQKDKYRQLIVNIKAESGLLTQLDLLKDMEQGQIDLEREEAELKIVQDDVSVKKVQVRNIRKIFEHRTKTINKEKASKLKFKSSNAGFGASKSNIEESKMGENNKKPPMVYSRRPTLYMPVIEQKVFDDLVVIKPNPKVSSKRRRK